MPTPTIDDIRARITTACEAIQAKGVRISTGHGWGMKDKGHEVSLVDERCCCPMGAVIHGMRPGNGSDYWYAPAREALGVCDEWIDVFAAGFDGADPGEYSERPDMLAYELGREFRRRYVIGEPEIR